MKAFLRAVLWIVVGAVTATGFFVNAFFPDYSSLGLRDQGLAILVLPLLAGFLLGFMLAEHELVHVAAGSLAMTGLVLALVGVFIFAPILAGLPSVIEGVSLLAVRQVGVSSILLFPTITTGTVLGHAFASSFFPPDQMREELRKLREETRKWHEELEDMKRQTPPPGP